MELLPVRTNLEYHGPRIALAVLLVHTKYSKCENLHQHQLQLALQTPSIKALQRKVLMQ